MAKVIYSQNYRLPAVLVGKTTSLVRLYVDEILPLSGGRYRLMKWVGTKQVSLVLHKSALRLDMDAVAIYRGCGYVSLNERNSSIMMGLSDNWANKIHHIKLTRNGESMSINDSPRRVA